jgi:GAF domain-containing protein
VEFQRNIDVLSSSSVIESVLRQLCDITGMGFAAVARVTEQRWIACHVHDKIEFGLDPGSELKVKTTICDEIRESRQPVYIDCVSDAPIWRTHPTPILYGFQSYVSVPLVLSDGSFFGTLCAVDPDPHVVDTPEIRDAIDQLALQVVEFLNTSLTGPPQG